MLFGIMDEIKGNREDMTRIKLNKAFSPESTNVRLNQGKVTRILGRAKELTDATYDTGTVTVANGSATVTGAGTGWLIGTLTPLWGSDDLEAATGRQIIITDSGDTTHTHTIKSVDSALQITLDTNYSGTGEGGLSYVIGVLGAKVIAPDENTIIRYHLHNDDINNIEYLFCYTKSHAYRWISTHSAFVLYYTNPGSDVTLWDTVSFNDKLISTSNQDFVQVWSDGAGSAADTEFADLDTVDSGLDLDGGSTFLTRAKYVTIYENYVLLGFTTEGGTVYPYRRRHSSLRDAEDWDETGDGDTGGTDFTGRGSIKGFGIYTANNANLLITFMKDGATGSLQTTWLVTEDIVFQNDELNNTLGLLATHSVVNDKSGNLYFVGTDYTIRRLFRDEPVSNAIENTIKNLNVTLQDNIVSTYIDQFNWLAWSIPQGDSSTGNDKVVYYDKTESDKSGLNIWYSGSWPARAFGSFTRQATLTIDGLDTLYDTIDGIGLATIDSTEQRAGFPLDIASDYSGYTFDLHASETDDGISFTGELVIVTDFSNKGTPTIFKRLNAGIEHIYETESTSDFTATHSYKTDNDGNWMGADSVNLAGTGKYVYPYIPYDLRSRLFQFRQQVTNRFAWVGMIVDFEEDGDR